MEDKIVKWAVNGIAEEHHFSKNLKIYIFKNEKLNFSGLKQSDF
jgi:hypothetical protein